MSQETNYYDLKEFIVLRSSLFSLRYLLYCVYPKKKLKTLSPHLPGKSAQAYKIQFADLTGRLLYFN